MPPFRAKTGMQRSTAIVLLLGAVMVLPQCYFMRPNAGGGPGIGVRMRRADPAAVKVPAGYEVELVADQLTCPTGVTFDGSGTPFVVESGFSPTGMFHTPRLLRIEADGKYTVIAEGTSADGPWNGVAFHDGAFLIAESGTTDGGRILRIVPGKRAEALVENLPGYGDHGVDGPVVGPDGAIYFGIGTATNSGVVGADNMKSGWLAKHPSFHDIPGQDIVLTGRNFTTPDVLGTRPKGPDGSDAKVQTGAFVPFGTATYEGQRIAGQLPCTGAVLKLLPKGELELVAWGFRNPFGLAFSPDRRLFVTDNGYDERGSRPVWGTGELLWEVHQGTWYGWPDFSGERPLIEDEFDPPGADAPRFLLAQHPNVPPRPAATLEVHASADGLDFSRNVEFGHVGDAFIALFGDQTPTTGQLLAPTGFKVVRVDIDTGIVREFAANGGSQPAPASRNGGAGLERPVAVRFDPSGRALYVVDFGIVREGRDGPTPEPWTGCLWRITRKAAPAVGVLTR